MNLAEKNHQNILSMIDQASGYFGTPPEEIGKGIVRELTRQPKSVIDKTYEIMIANHSTFKFPDLKHWVNARNKAKSEIGSNPKLQNWKLSNVEKQIQDKIELLQHTSHWYDIYQKIISCFDPDFKISMQPLKLTDDVVVMIENKRHFIDLARYEDRFKELPFTLYICSKVKDDSTNSIFIDYIAFKEVSKYNTIPFVEVSNHFKLFC